MILAHSAYLFHPGTEIMSREIFYAPFGAVIGQVIKVNSVFNQVTGKQVQIIILQNFQIPVVTSASEHTSFLYFLHHYIWKVTS